MPSAEVSVQYRPTRKNYSGSLALVYMPSAEVSVQYRFTLSSFVCLVTVVVGQRETDKQCAVDDEGGGEVRLAVPDCRSHFPWRAFLKSW